MITSQVALITGSARRIGAAIATALHQAGINVVIHYHTSDKEAQELCQKLNQSRANSATTLCADLSEIANSQVLIQKAVDAWGRLDILVNNASRFYPTKLGEVTEEAWDDLFNSNLKSLFFLSQAAARFISVNSGSIINITDIHGETPLRDYGVYCLTKAGVIMLTKVLAKELAPNVRVNGISPGTMIWPEGKSSLSEEAKQKVISQIALQRQGSPEDIAQMVLFLVKEGGYMTGQVIAVDGGRSI